MSKSLAGIIEAKPESRLRIYAWVPNTPSPEYSGQIKVGQTTGDVNARIIESQGQARQAYTLLFNEPAERIDGSIFTDTEVRRRLHEKGFESVVHHGSREWVRCSINDLRAAYTELRHGVRFSQSRYQSFKPRKEQQEAIDKTRAYFASIWNEDPSAVPRFLWNAKMRFGKTFTAYQLAKKLNAKRTLVVTFKPAVEDSWRTDLESHVDFEGWQYFSKASEGTPADADPDKPLVYFGSFQDLLGKEAVSGAIKAKNEWLHTVVWDLVIFDEYHFGAWRDRAKELFEGEDDKESSKELAQEYASSLEVFDVEFTEFASDEPEFLPISTRAYLYLSGTPFKALATGEFIEDQIFNWTYTDEQRAKKQFEADQPNKPNPYASLPEMQLFTYQMPEELLAVASGGQFDEFDLNSFFEATGVGVNAHFKFKNDVQKWLDIIRGSDLKTRFNALKSGGTPPFPYSDVHLLPYLQHSFWYLPTVASCHAMANLLKEPQNVYWHDYEVVVAAGPGAGIGLNALPPVRSAIKSGFDTKTITLSCGKLTTGVTVPQWSAILMLRNLQSPESYFQAAFRVQSPWAINNPNGDDPQSVEILKPNCFVFDFAPTRALRQVSDYAIGLNPDEANPELAVQDLIQFLPVLAFDGANMARIDAGGILDIAMSGTSATLLARKWESAELVHVDNGTLKKIMADKEALEAIMRIEGFRSLGSDVFETVVNKSEKVKEVKTTCGGELDPKEKKELSKEEREYKSLRKKIQEKLIKFATRIPAFMYLTDYRENTLKDVITKLEPELFKSVTGLTVSDFNLLVSLGVFNATKMNDAVFAFRRYEDASLTYTGIESHKGLTHYGGYDTVVAVEDF